MATELGVAYLSILPETSKLTPGISKAMAGAAAGADRTGKRVAAKFGTGFNTGMGSVIRRSAGLLSAGFGAVKIGGFLKDAIGQASDLNETTSKVGQIFGPAAKNIMAFSKTSATALGQTQQAALDANATFGIFGKAAGLHGQGLSGFTTKLTTLAGDLASFNNTSPEQAIEAIGSALRGESEPIRAYGVLLDDASLRQEALAQGLIKTTKQALTPQQRVLAAQALIMKQTTTAQGDFARTSGGLANQQRILSARFSDFKTTLGAVALPLAVRFFGFMNREGIPALQHLGDKIITFTKSAGFRTFLTDAATAAASLFLIFKRDVLPALQTLGTFITGTLIPALAGLSGFLSRHQTLVITLAAAWLSLATASKAFDVAKMISNAGGLAAYLQNLKLVQMATKAWTAVQWLLNLSLWASPITWIILGIAALVVVILLLWKKNEAFRKALTDAWNAIRVAASAVFGAVKTAVAAAISFVRDHWRLLLGIIGGPLIAIRFLVSTFWGWVKALFFTAVAAVVAGLKVWAAVKDRLTAPIVAARNALARILGAGKGGVQALFRGAVDVIGKLWNGLQDLVKKPIRFILETVLNNGLIAGFNAIASKFHAPQLSPIPIPPGLARGGRIPGRASSTDNMIATSPYGPMGVASGEYLVNARQTAKNLPLLEAINSGKASGTTTAGQPSINLTINYPLPEKVSTALPHLLRSAAHQLAPAL